MIIFFSLPSDNPTRIERVLDPATSSHQSLIDSDEEEGWRSGVKLFLSAINPIPPEGWKDSRFYGKIYMVMRVRNQIL